MYAWRQMTPPQRAEATRFRRQCQYPWHSPPHFHSDRPRYFHLSAACYNHVPIIGHSPARMTEFEASLLQALRECTVEVRAWCVLPNHWHALAKTDDLKRAARHVGRLHGRTSRVWNCEDGSEGRKCWFACADRWIRSEAHMWATLNYIHHNAVHHGYSERWQDWPYSSAASWLDRVGVDEARRVWDSYPLMDYGRSWDDPAM